MSHVLEQVEVLKPDVEEEARRYEKDFKERAVRAEKERLEIYRAEVEAGLVDPERLRKYFEIRKSAFDVIRREPAPLDEEAQEEAWRVAQEQVVLSQSYAVQSLNHPPQVVHEIHAQASSWTSPDPKFEGDADANVTVVPAQKGFIFDLDAQGWKLDEPLSACAWSYATIVFKILAFAVPFGRVELFPYVTYPGQVKVVSEYPPSYGASSYGATASIGITTSWYQGTWPPKDWWLFKPGSFFTIWERHHPPGAPDCEPGGWYVISKGPDPIARIYPEAKVVADVVSWSDLYVKIDVTATAEIVGKSHVRFLPLPILAVPYVQWNILAEARFMTNLIAKTSGD